MSNVFDDDTDTDDDDIDPFADESGPISNCSGPSFWETLDSAFGPDNDSTLAVDALEKRIKAEGLRQQQKEHGDTPTGSIFTAPYLQSSLVAVYGATWWESVRFKVDLFTLKNAIDQRKTEYGPLLNAAGGLNPANVKLKGRPGDPRHIRAQGLYQILTSGVKYIRATERGRYRIQFENGVLKRKLSRKDASPVPFDTRKVNAKAGASGKWVAGNAGDEDKCLWVMLQGDKNQVSFYSHAMKRGRFHHSSLNAGNGVAAAGEWETDSNGRITRIYGSSGHYKPEPWRILWALRELNKVGALVDAMVHTNKGFVGAQEILTNLTTGHADKIDLY